MEGLYFLLMSLIGLLVSPKVTQKELVLLVKGFMI